MHQICRLIAKSPTKLSQVMHTAAFKTLELDFSYELFDTEDTKHALDEMRRLSLRGCSLTIPHKESAIKLLDSFSEDVEVIGAANTVVNENGKLLGFNTDWLGIEESLNEVSVKLKDKNVLILGAGGASRAALYLFKKLKVRKVFLKNRTLERAESLAKEFSSETFEISAGVLDDISSNELLDSELLINSTPMGSHLASSSEEFITSCVQHLPSTSTVFDMVTKEETAFITAAKNKGLKAISGLRMLLHQAVWQNHYFTNAPLSNIPVKKMEEALYLEARKL